MNVTTYTGYSPVSIVNSGDFTVKAGRRVGIRAVTTGGNSPISIVNSGDFTVNASGPSATGDRQLRRDQGIDGVGGKAGMRVSW